LGDEEPGTSSLATWGRLIDAPFIADDLVEIDRNSSIRRFEGRIIGPAASVLMIKEGEKCIGIEPSIWLDRIRHSKIPDAESLP
jgi:hypothetical protein